MRLKTLNEELSPATIEHWEESQYYVDPIAKASGININRIKEPLFVAVVDGQPVGATWYSFEEDHETDMDDVYVFDFDVAVLPEFRSGLIGLKLIEDTLRYYQGIDCPGTSYISVMVINPKLARVLENRYGFTLEADFGHNHYRMVKY